jgi:hypothetical protein
MMGKGMAECKRKCEMMKEKCKGMMGKGSESCMGEGMRMEKMMMKPGDDAPMKCLEMHSMDAMKPPMMGDELKKEMEDLKHEIENLKKEIERLRES